MTLNAEKVFVLEDAINTTFNAALAADVVTESRVWRAMTDESINTVHFAVKQARDAARMAHDVFEEIFASVMAAAKREEEQPEGSDVLDLIAADEAMWQRVTESHEDVEDALEAEADNKFEQIMAARCSTLAEIRAKLHWMTKSGGGCVGEEEAFAHMVADLDAIIAKQT